MTKKCLRCGKEYARLKQHIQSKNVCSPMYMDIDRDIMYKNYDIFYKKFLKIKKNGEYKKPCIVCSKHIMSKNMSRHVFTKHPHYKNSDNINDDNIQSDQVNMQGDQVNTQGDQVNMQGDQVNMQGDQVNIQGDQVNMQGDQVNIQGDQVNLQGDQVNIQGDQVNIQGDQVNIQGGQVNIQINFNLNNFGNENNIKLIDALIIYENYSKNTGDLKDVKALINYIEKMHMQITANMNIYRDKKSKYARCYIDGKWTYMKPKDLFLMIVENTSKHITANLVELDIADKNKSFTIKRGENKKVANISKYIKSGIELNKYIKSMIKTGYNKDSVFIEDWKEFNILLDLLFLNYKEKLTSIYKLTKNQNNDLHILL
jgi:uncharacterized Zn-binding protein involved in type VI secretion